MSENASKAESRSIILAKDGKPFGTENAANLVMNQKGFTFETHEIIAYSGGFAIKDKRSPAKEADASKDSSSTQSKPRFFKVRFQEKGDSNQPDDVQLGANGDLLILKRGEPVVIPEVFVNVARDARHLEYDYTPGAARKHPVQIIKYPFDILGEGTEAEYLEMRYGKKAQAQV